MPLINPRQLATPRNPIPEENLPPIRRIQRRLRPPHTPLGGDFGPLIVRNATRSRNFGAALGAKITRDGLAKLLGTDFEQGLCVCLDAVGQEAERGQRRNEEEGHVRDQPQQWCDQLLLRLAFR